MTTPNQKGKTDPTKDPARPSGGTLDVVVEIRLTGSKTQVAADFATITGASYTANSVSISFH